MFLGLVLHGGAREMNSREIFLEDLEPLPLSGGVVEVVVWPINLTWIRRGRGGYIFLANCPPFLGCGRGRG